MAFDKEVMNEVNGNHTLDVICKLLLKPLNHFTFAPCPWPDKNLTSVTSFHV